MDESTDTIRPTTQTTFHVPDTAAFRPYTSTAASYLAANPTLTHLVVGTVLFRDSLDGLCILLTQRSATNYVPLKWEIPGGKCDPASGETVLEAAARELREETGLEASGFLRVVDEDTEFGDDGVRGSGERVWRKITFEVEELCAEEGGCEVTIDPREHNRFAWATEEEVRAGVIERDGVKVELDFTFEVQKEVILRAFELRKGKGET